MIKKVDHVSIAVSNIEEGLKTFETLLGIKAGHVEEIPDQGVKAAKVEKLEKLCLDVEIELIEPTKPDTGVAKFLEKKGEGIHHICFEVDDVDKELESLAGKGVDLIDKQGRKGLAGMVGFIHPRSTKGVLVELAQKV